MMQWCVGLVTITFLGCATPAANPDPYCVNADPYDECEPAPIVTAHWQFVTLGGDSSDCLPGAPSVEISTQSFHGNNPVDFSAPCEGGQATHPLDVLFDVVVSSRLDHAYATRVPFTLSPTGDLPTAVILTDAGDVQVDVTGLSGYELNCSPDPYGLASVAVQIDDGVPTESPCAQASQTLFSRVMAGPHQLLATGYDSTHALVAHADPVDFTALGGTTVDVTVAIAR